MVGAVYISNLNSECIFIDTHAAHGVAVGRFYLDDQECLVPSGVFCQIVCRMPNGRTQVFRTTLRADAIRSMAEGLSEGAAFAALTAAAAETVGVAELTGSIEVGLRADLVLWGGEPFDLRSSADRVWVAGKAVAIAL